MDIGKPTARLYGEMYRISYGKTFVYVLVHSDGLISLWMYSWSGLRYPPGVSNSKHENEIYDWLTEWELIERRQVGPVDFAHFATEKLIGKES